MRDQATDRAFLKRYELEWKEYHHLDWTYIQITAIYNTLITIYILKLNDIHVSKAQLVPFILIVFIIISGIIFRTRALLDRTRGNIRHIENQLGIELGPLAFSDREQEWLFRLGVKIAGGFRTSFFLLLLVWALSGFALVATIMK